MIDPSSMGVLLKRLENPDEVKTFPKGRFETIALGPMIIGRAIYEPGWRWSEHVGAATGQRYCEVEHVGLVLEGVATAAFANGTVVEMRVGDFFHVPGVPHDSWVVGDQPYVSLHFAGADSYATTGDT